jgi:hypothetical protein
LKESTIFEAESSFLLAPPPGRISLDCFRLSATCKQ